MCSLMWCMSILVLLAVDIRTGALQHQEGIVHECRVCIPGNNTTCEQSSEWSSVICPVDRPLCATIAIAPNFRSSLGCSAARKSPCSLTHSSQNILSLNCVCSERLCNVPFSRQLRNELLNFSSKNNTSINLTEAFLKMVMLNATDVNLHKMVAIDVNESNRVPINNSLQITTLSSVTSSISEDSHLFTRQSEFRPRVEALKQESTAPSDDDEDENEGSGSYEETKSHSQPASAPAAPSSFLPANENKAAKLFINLYLITYFLLRVIM